MKAKQYDCELLWISLLFTNINKAQQAAENKQSGTNRQWTAF